jgi:hypothetical protein
MKKIGIAVASAALLAALAAPAAAAVASGPSDVLHQQDSQPHACYGHRSWDDRGECYDEHRPQHDGGGSILF